MPAPVRQPFHLVAVSQLVVRRLRTHRRSKPRGRRFVPPPHINRQTEIRHLLSLCDDRSSTSPEHGMSDAKAAGGIERIETVRAMMEVQLSKTP